MVRAILFGVLLALISGCAAPKGDTVDEKRAYALDVRKEALAELTERFPELQGKLDSAAGHAFLSTFVAHPGWITFANGYGVVEDNASKEVTHMRMFRFGIGPGIAFRGNYVFIVLETEEALAKFRDGTGAVAGYAEACFNFGDFGGSAAAEGLAGEGVEAYSWTHTGLGLELTILGGKVWPKSELNEEPTPEP